MTKGHLFPWVIAQKWEIPMPSGLALAYKIFFSDFLYLTFSKSPALLAQAWKYLTFQWEFSSSKYAQIGGKSFLIPQDFDTHKLRITSLPK